MPVVHHAPCIPSSRLKAATARTQGATCHDGSKWRWWLAARAVQQRRRQPVRLAAGAVNSTRSADAADKIELVKRLYGNHGCALLLVRPELAAELRPLAALAGVADASKLSRAVAALGPKRERRVLEHGPAVAKLLLSLGVQRPQLAELLLACPLLFCWPADERAAVLFGELARLGLTAPEAARCIEQQPSAAGSLSFEPAVAVLAPLFAAASKAGSGKSGEQLLGDFLRKQPAAVGLLAGQPSTLQQRLSNLVQRYGPHWNGKEAHAVIVASVRQAWALLNLAPEHLLAVEAVLQQEVGQQPGDGTRLLAHLLQHRPQAAGCSVRLMQQRSQALVAEFGREALLQAKAQPVAAVLACNTALWQRALAVWRLLGVAEPAALARTNLQMIAVDWLLPGRLANLAALQRLLPWQPSAVDVVQQFPTYVAGTSTKRLIGRLLFLQQEDLLPLLLARKQGARQQWRQQRRLRAEQPADEPQFISLRNVAVLSDAKFCSMLATSQPEQPGSSNSSSGASSVAERHSAFMERLPQLPAYQQLLAEGAAESQRLAALLPPELAATAADSKGNA